MQKMAANASQILHFCKKQRKKCHFCNLKYAKWNRSAYDYDENTTDLKLLHILIEETVGKIISEEISNAPIIFIPITTVIAVRAEISILYTVAFVPVALAKFSSKVTANIS